MMGLEYEDEEPNPGSYPLLGRRGRKDSARRTLLPTVYHPGQRARFFVASNPKISGCEFMQPLPSRRPIDTQIAAHRRRCFAQR